MVVVWRRAAATAAGRWGPRVALSILDQGLFSGANFVLNVLLARWLPLGEYGAFSVAFAAFLLLAGFHSALILEPMGALGVGYRSPGLGRYLRILLGMHAVLTVALSLAIAAAALVVVDAPSRSAYAGLALALPLLLLYWLTRRAWYLESRAGAAALGSAVYAAVLLAATAGLANTGGLSSLTAFLAMGLASLLASVWCLPRLGVTGRNGPLDDPAVAVWAVAADHWRYGRWVVLIAVVSPLMAQVQTYVVAAFVGLEGAGVLRALLNFALPMAQATTAVGTLALPVLAADYQAGRYAAMARKGTWVSLGLGGLALVYELGLVVLGQPLERVVYGGRFAGLVWLIPVFGLVPVFAALASGYATELRAAQRPDRELLATALTIPVGLASALAMTAAWGVAGAAISLVLTYAASGMLLYILCQQVRTELARRAVSPAVGQQPQPRHITQPSRT